MQSAKDSESVILIVFTVSFIVKAVTIPEIDAAYNKLFDEKHRTGEIKAGHVVFISDLISDTDP